MARKTTAEVVVKGTDQASGAFRSVGSSAKGMGTAVGESAEQAKKAESGFTKFTNFLKSRFVITLGDVSRAVGAVFRAIKDASDLSSQTNALKLSLAQQGQDFNTYIAKLKDVSRGTVSTSDLIRSSSKALLLGIPATQIAKLLDIARVSAIATGQSVQTAFDDIATGIGRASPLILDNLGIVVKIGKANDAYAKEIGKVTSELTAQEQKQALLNAVLKTGEERIKLFGESADETAIALQRGQAALVDFKTVAGSVASLLGGVLVTGFIALTSVVLNVAIGFQSMRQAWFELIGFMDKAKGIEKTVDTLKQMNKEVVNAGIAMSNSTFAQFNTIMGKTDEKVKVAKVSIAEFKEEVVETAEVVKETATEVEELGETMKVLDTEVVDVTASVDQALLPALVRVDEQLKRTSESARGAALSFDDLAASQSRASAVLAIFERNIAAGDPTGGLTLGGTRINLPGGGSRLVPPGTFSNISTNGDSTGRPGADAFSRRFLGF